MVEKIDLKQIAGRGLTIAGLALVSGCATPQEKAVRADSTPTNPYTIIVEGQNYRLKQVSRQGIEIWGWGNAGGAEYRSRLQGLRDLNEKCDLLNWSDSAGGTTITAVTTREDYCLLKFKDK